jgi:quinol monooxygenase YgiN
MTLLVADDLPCDDERRRCVPMYGTIARIHPKPDRIADLRAMGETMMAGVPPAGYRWSYFFEPDLNPYDRPTMFLVAMFDDEATYRANAGSPEQDALYRQLRELLEDDPDWSDGTFFGR